MKIKGKGALFALVFLCIVFNSATIAHAVIPQLLGPLSALVSILPQILVVVGIAVVAVFKPSTYRMLIYHIRESASRHKAIAAILAIVIVGGVAVFAYQALQPAHPSIKTAVGVRPTVQATISSTSQSTWSAFRGGITRTGHLDELPGPMSAESVWTFKETGPMMVDFSASPAVAGDRVYIASAQGSIFSTGGAVYCLDANSGDVRWQYPSPIQIFSSPTVVGGRVYVGEGFHQDTNCHLYCLNASDGSPIWTFQTASHVESSPFVSQGKVYFGAGEDGVYCVDALEGKEIWHYPSIHVDMSPAVWEGTAYFGSGYGEYRIYAVDANTGEEL
ncbi:MAG: PQQ-binding-like beta-propeller repeat protein, partial [Candidatus Poribacteria bacterium]|nr:PQQ-binding-like beta-propeller repeat protein [Candidatus Poribacteria bacterium]